MPTVRTPSPSAARSSAPSLSAAPPPATPSTSAAPSTDARRSTRAEPGSRRVERAGRGVLLAVLAVTVVSLAGSVLAVRTGLSGSWWEAVGPTGRLYYAVHALGTDGGVMVTGSHNLPGENGFKILLGTEPVHGRALRELVLDPHFPSPRTCSGVPLLPSSAAEERSGMPDQVRHDGSEWSSIRSSSTKPPACARHARTAWAVTISHSRPS